MGLLGILILLLLVGWGLLWLWPDDREAFHVDPADQTLTRRTEVRLLGQDAPRFKTDAETLMAGLLEVMRSEPRSRLLDGGPDEGVMTFVSRSVLGFRDYTSFKAVDEVQGAKLSILARPRINGYDWGVNAARVDRIILALEQRFGRP